MSAKQSHQATEQRPRVGEGRIGGFICAAIGLMSVASVLCLRFPAFLTTPELRVHYDVELLRLLLAICMIVAAGLGSLSLMLGGPRLRVAVGIGGLFLAMVLGGPYVPTQDFVQPRLYLGLDWLLLDLFFTGSGWILLEWMFPRVRPEQPPLREGWRLDLVYFGVNHLAIGVFLVVSTHFAHDAFGWAVNAWTQTKVNALPGIARFVLIILAADLAEYVLHRAFHEVPWLWRIHAIHHSPSSMDWLSGSRLHFLEPLATRSLILVPIFLLGFPQDTIFAYLIFVSVQSTLIHSNIRLNAGWLRYVIVTPQFHHWHHASDAEAIDRNYTAHTPLWDLLFGTWHLPKDRWPVQYGTVKPVPGGMLGQLLYPITGSVEGFRQHWTK
jgi:sterol desaturase/sphingolipid hydroxylase (fatty acid hydroxylase superfamily)